MANDLKQELLALETRFWQAMIDQDAQAASALVAEPSIVTGAQGVAKIDRKSFAKMMDNPSWELKSFEFGNVEVERLSDDVAVIGYKVREDLIVDGKPLTLEAADSSTWVRRDGAWLCALHTESVLGDPFGRKNSM